MSSPDADVEGHQPYRHAMVAGGIGGTTADMLMHSLDTVKTRQQGDSRLPPRYSNLPSAYSTIFRQEGVRRGLYGGWVPAFLGSLPGTVIFFGTYEFSKRFLRERGLQEHLTHLSAGLLGDLAGSVVYVPSEVLKTRLQLQGQYNNPFFRSGFNYLGTMDAARKIVRQEGVSAFFHGYRATIARDLPFSALQFMFWEQFRSWAQWYRDGSRDVGYGLEMLTGAAAGGLAGVITCPLDVVKTRLQTQLRAVAVRDLHDTSIGSGKSSGRPGPVAVHGDGGHVAAASQASQAPAPSPQSRHISTSSPSTHVPRLGASRLDTSSVVRGLRVILNEEGVAGWFRGVVPRGVWTFIQSGCMLFLYQRILRQLEGRDLAAAGERRERNT